MPHPIDPKEPVELAIVGGGIVGLVLALGLVRQNLNVKVYEQARNFRELGVGIAFTAATVKCMEMISPTVVKALRCNAVNLSIDEKNPNSYLRWLDGYNQPRPEDPSFQKRLCDIDAGYKGWEGVRRDQFLEAMFKSLPPNIVQFQKRLNDIEQGEDGGKVTLKFVDGTEAKVDAVFGADGIKSRARAILLGPDNPCSYPQYTNKVAYRTLVPKDKVLEIMGEYKTMRQHMHIGPGANLIHYPVSQTQITATIFVSDPNDWPRDQPMTAKGHRKQVEDAVEGWCLPVRQLIAQFPEELDCWALFDLWEHPLPAYNYGRVCLLGDAAHASSPHHGAGASMGIEDALCLSTLLEEVTTAVDNGASQHVALKTAFETYDAMRRTRTQWLVNSSRRVCDLYQQPEWSDPTKQIKAESCFEEIRDRSYKIWHFKPSVMVEETIEDFSRRHPEASLVAATKAL